MIIILVQLRKMTVSPGAFWIFLKFSFFHFMYLRNCTYDSGFWYRCVKWWYLQQFFFFFSFFQNSNFSNIHMSTKNHSHVRYSSWDKESDKFVLSLWTIFWPLPHSPIMKTQSTKILKKWKMHLDIWRCHHFKLVQQKKW